ncbi:MAG: hypothetical protein IJF01_07220 [Tidjanibacter sp.]|nr:hypothetical protein [Tidjanibacter sp.]
MADRIQHRRDTAAGWTAANPTLLEGEIGIVLDSPSHYKVGDGLTAWNDLPLRGWDGALVQEPGNDAQTAMSQKAITEAIAATEQRVEGKIGNLKEEMTDNYAKQDGTYRKMSVGFAENVVGDGSATEEEFSFRPTAGVNRNTLNDGAARIHTLKGNSVVWNQSARVRTNTVSNNGISVTNDGVKSTVIGTAEADTNISLANAWIPVNHKCILKGCPANGSVDTFFSFITDNGNKIDAGEGVLFTNTNNDTIWLNLTVKQGTTVDLVIYPLLYDLTKMFGAGNEPTTVEKFYQRMPIGVDLNAYNEGTIIDGNYDAIKTTGFNAFNSTYAKVLGGVQYYLGGNYTSIGFTTEEGGTTEAITVPTSAEVVGGSAPADRLYTPSQNGYIYATGENICISLYWPTEYGNLYGTYKPYKPFERDLGDIIVKYFTDGVMRSAGTIRDEIRFNTTTQKWEAMQKVGVVDLGSLSWGMQADSNIFIATIEGMAPADIHEKRQNGILCEKYGIAPATSINVSMQNGSILRLSSSVAIRDTSFLSSADFTTAIQGIILNYELAEPIVTEIEEIPNFDFDVSDYGTEELIVAEGEQSAPLVADIEYSPNALAVLKNAPDITNDVDALKSQVAALTEQLAALTTANTNE